MSNEFFGGMKRKTIKRILKAKLNSWLESIKDEEVRKIAAENVFVTGGSIVSLLTNQPVNDYDLYFKSKEAVTAIGKYYCGEFSRLNPDCQNIPIVKEITATNLNGEEENRVVIWVQSAGAVVEDSTSLYQYFEVTDNADGDQAEGHIDEMRQALKGTDITVKEEDGRGRDKYRPIFLSTNAITLSDKVQLIIRFFGQPEDIYKNYDFIHVRNSYDFASDTLNLSPQALEAILSKTLYYTGSLYPIASIFRSKKFIERGWKVSAGQLLKIMFQIRKIDFNDPFVLREQLTGCDMAYFHQLITHINTDRETVGDAFTIDDTYLSKLIDLIFNESMN